MPRVEESIVIARTPKEVWDYVTDPAHDAVWMSNVVEYEADWEQEPQVGDGTCRVARVAGRRCEMTCEVTEVVPGEMFAWKSVEAPFPFENAFRVEETEEGTRLTFFGKLADPIVAQMFSRDMRSNLKNLKTILEKS